MCFITDRNEVVVKVMFLHVCVILFTGGSPARKNPHRTGRPPGQGEPPWEQTPPRADTPRGQIHLGANPPRQGEPPGADTPQSRHLPRSTLQHMVNEPQVCILLKCILVLENASDNKNEMLMISDIVYLK